MIMRRKYHPEVGVSWVIRAEGAKRQWSPGGGVHHTVRNWSSHWRGQRSEHGQVQVRQQQTNKQTNTYSPNWCLWFSPLGCSLIHTELRRTRRKRTITHVQSSAGFHCIRPTSVAETAREFEWRRTVCVCGGGLFQNSVFIILPMGPIRIFDLRYIFSPFPHLTPTCSAHSAINQLEIRLCNHSWNRPFSRVFVYAVEKLRCTNDGV